MDLYENYHRSEYPMHKLIDLIDLLTSIEGTKKHCSQLTAETQSTLKAAKKSVRRSQALLALIP